MPRGVYDRSKVKKDKTVESLVPKKRGRPPGKAKESKEKDAPKNSLASLSNSITESDKPDKTAKVKKFKTKIDTEVDMVVAASNLAKHVGSSYDTNPIYLSSQVRDNLHTLNDLHTAFGSYGGKLAESITTEISNHVAILSRLSKEAFGVPDELPALFTEDKPAGTINSEYKASSVSVPTVPSLPVNH